MYDTLIKNGTIIDGSGAPRYRGDIALAGGRIAEIGKISDGAKEAIDASDLVVAPGFVDPHTHYDAQISWDKELTPSIWHGVTSVVMGNCGVGIAPVKPDDKSREIATRDLVLVEDISYDVLKRGIDWTWSSFPEYMDAADKRGCALNTGFIAPLTPFRHFVMGEESLERAATPQEAEAVKKLLVEAVSAGALGVSTTRLLNHVGYKGLPLACRQADQAELKTYLNGLRDLGKGCIQYGLTNTGSIVDGELEVLDFITRESGRPVTWLALLERDDQPSMCQDTLRAVEPYFARGAVPQVSARPLTLTIDMYAPKIVAMSVPCFKATLNQPREALLQLYADKGFRETFRRELRENKFMFSARWDLMLVHEAETLAVQALKGRVLTDIARERGADPLDTFFDLALEDRGGVEYSYEAFNVAEDRVAKLLTDPRTMIGVSDGGAHVDMLCDASYSTYLLGHWVREMEALTLEHAVKRLTSEPADFFGLSDRGRIARGAAADLVIFDPARIGSPRRPSEMRTDLPGGGKRLITYADGIDRTLVNGRTVLKDGQPTGAMPGRVLRSH